MQITNILEQLGLSDNEAKVYLAGLELGKATIQELSRKSGVKRTTVYVVMDGLKEKGVFSQTKKNAKTFFIAQDPENMVDLLEKRLQGFKTALPELKSIYNIAEAKPKVRFYEGREGYLSVYENILRERPKELLVIASYDDFKKHIDEDYEEDWTIRRIKQGTYLRWLDFETTLVKAKAIKGKKGLREVRFLPNEFKFTSTMFIYGDKVVLVSGKQRDFIAIVIENQEFSQMFRQFFEMLWFFVKR